MTFIKYLFYCAIRYGAKNTIDILRTYNETPYESLEELLYDYVVWGEVD